jgi:hypothetical protein
VRVDQRSLRETRPHRDLLARLDIEGRLVVDLGVGHVEITDLILERRPSRLIACDEDAQTAGAELLSRDLSSMGLLPENCIVISNPPSDVLQHVLDVLDRSRVRDVLMMVAENHTNEIAARGFEVVFRLEADAFEPPMECAYVVAIRWATRGSEKERARPW